MTQQYATYSHTDGDGIETFKRVKVHDFLAVSKRMAGGGQDLVPGAIIEWESGRLSYCVISKLMELSTSQRLSHKHQKHMDGNHEI